MRGIRTAGVGLSLALSTAAAWAQAPAPAVTFGPIRVLDAGETPIATVRGQQPDPRMAQPIQRMPYQIPAGAPTAYTGATTPMPMQAGSDPLGTPKPTPTPMVTELRDQYGQPLTVSPTQGTVVPPPVFGAAQPYNLGACETCGPQATGVADPYADPSLGAGLFPRIRNAIAGGPTAGRLNVTTDYLLWYIRGQSAPPLVTTSSPQFNGIIGQGDTRVLYGNGQLNNPLMSGGRFWANYWFPCSQWGLDGGVWFLGQTQTNWATDSSQNPLIARPFINVNAGQNFSELTAFPGVASGSINVNTQASAWGAEANLRRAIIGNASSRLDGLIGFKYMNLTEQLAITENFQRLPGAPPAIGVPGAVSGTVVDQFNTTNNFYGVNLGLSGEVRRGRWFANGRATVGLGQVYQHADINGYQQINFANGTTQRTAGGLLALPNANIGSYNETHFGVMPEVGLTIGYYITQNLRFGIGYNFMYLNSVIRPANLIDPGLDVTKVPNFPLVPAPTPLTTNRPSAVPFQTSDIAIQGLTFSLNWAF
jgi:hypothetical protein